MLNLFIFLSPCTQGKESRGSKSGNIILAPGTKLGMKPGGTLIPILTPAAKLGRKPGGTLIVKAVQMVAVALPCAR